jgi:hypothetical protein
MRGIDPVNLHLVLPPVFMELASNSTVWRTLMPE